MQHTTHSNRLAPQARLLTAAALVSGVLVAGCGRSSPSPTTAAGGASTSASTAASAGTRTTTATTGGTASSGSTAPSAYRSGPLGFAECMRANGVPNFPDPNGSGGFPVCGGFDPGSPVVRTAQAKCRHLMPPGPGSGPPPSAQTLARFLKIARCMRRHGVPQFPDPQTSAPPGGPPAGISELSDIEGVILLFPSSIDQQSPVFTRAAAACAFPLHNH